MDSIFHIQYQDSQTSTLRMLLQCRTSQVRAVGSGILRVLWRPAVVRKLGCVVFGFKNQPGLLPCFLLSSSTTCPSWSPTVSVLPPWAPCGHFYVSLSFLFPHLCTKAKHSTHSFIPQIECGGSVFVSCF